MSARRGRKKAPVKQPQQHPDADDEILNPESALKSDPPAPPASPLVALVAQAVSPIVTAARAVSVVAAAALPTIPESQAATASQVLDVDHGLAATPGSPVTTHNPFTAPATSRHTRSRTAGLRFGTTNIKQENVDQQHDLADDLQQPDDQNPPATVIDINNGSSALLCLSKAAGSVRPYSSYILFALLSMVFITALWRQQRSLRAHQAISLQQQQQIAAQATLLHSLQGQLQQTTQQLQQRPDMQQLESVATSCSAGLEHLNSTQLALHSSLGQLESLAQQLAANITSLESQSKIGIQAWEALANLTAAQEAAQQSESLQHDTTEAMQSNISGADVPSSPSASAPAANSEQQISQQQINSHEILETLPGLIQEEVHQQLTAKLPPLDLALASCGAQVVFHTPANMSSSRQGVLQAEGAKADHPASSPASSSNLAVASTPSSNASAQSKPAAAGSVAQRIHSVLHQLHVFVLNHLRLLASQAGIQIHMPPANITKAGWPSPLQQQLFTSPHASRLLLSSGAQLAGRCVALEVKDSTPAVVEIALPQMMEVHSVTLHYPSSTGQSSPSDANAAAAAWLKRAPGHVSVELVNSSSCRTASVAAHGSFGGPALCSMAGHVHRNRILAASVQDNVTDDRDSDAATSTLTGSDHQASDADAGQFSTGSSLLVPGVVGVGRSEEFSDEYLMTSRGRSVIDLRKTRADAEQRDGDADAEGTRATAGRGVYADRIVVMVSTVTGKAGGGVCLQRISVQGAPTDVSAFC